MPKVSKKLEGHPILNPAYFKIIVSIHIGNYNSFNIAKDIGESQPNVYNKLLILEKNGFILNDNNLKKNYYTLNYKKLVTFCNIEQKILLNALFDEITLIRTKFEKFYELLGEVRN